MRTAACPLAAIFGPDGQPWHSWRVLVLPFMERGDLYAKYRFDQPWNSPHNRTLEPLVARAYQRPEDTRDSPFTRFVAVVGDHAAFPNPPTPPRVLEEIPDGISKTLLFVEVQGLDIPWMEPRDLPFDSIDFHVNKPGAAGIGSPYGGARAALGNGHILSLDDRLDPKALRALLTADGGEPLFEDDNGQWRIQRP